MSAMRGCAIFYMVILFVGACIVFYGILIPLAVVMRDCSNSLGNSILLREANLR